MDATVTTAPAERRSFPAMGAEALVIVVGGPEGLADRAVERIDELERRWSRFRSDSEVSRHNASIAAGTTGPELSDDTLLLFDRAAEGHAVTRGRFDPYRLDAVVAAGYAGPITRPGAAPDAAPTATTTGFDPGGIGKGLAADVVTQELLDAGATGALVSIGGDLRVRGTSPSGDAWRIEIEDPRTGAPLTAVELTDGAVATSSRVKRRWTADDGTQRHHLIDPSTGEPSTSTVLAATVVAAEGWQAEVLAKVAVLDAFGDGALSADAGLELIEQLRAAALVVTDDLVLPTARWESFDVGDAPR